MGIEDLFLVLVLVLAHDAVVPHVLLGGDDLVAAVHGVGGESPR